jgi:hypothetical protein
LVDQWENVDIVDEAAEQRTEATKGAHSYRNECHRLVQVRAVIGFVPPLGQSNFILELGLREV